MDDDKSDPQKQLGFIDRDELVARICLPKSITVKDSAVSSRVVRAVFFRINQHIGNRNETFVGQATLARETEYGERTVERATEALASLGVLKITRKKSQWSRFSCNHYCVNWDRVSELAQVQQHPELAQVQQSQEVPQEHPVYAAEVESQATNPPPDGGLPPLRMRTRLPGDDVRCPRVGGPFQWSGE